MNKKTFAIIGMAVSVAIALLGVLTLTGALGGDASYASGASYLYDSGYTTFGADFYTYVSNNAAEAASASRTAASNLREIAELLKNAFGILLAGFGLLGFCHFGIVWADCKTVASVCVETAPTSALPAAEPAEKAAVPEEESASVEV